MKKFKKLTAVLLAAVMALAMLTACGGGGGSGSRSERERYIAGINDYLADNIDGGCREITYDDAVNQKAVTYQEKYELFAESESPSEADLDAKIVAGINKSSYRVIAVELKKKDSEKEKIATVAVRIWAQIGPESLQNDQWTVGYSWGESSYKDKTKTIYIVLHQVDVAN